ncbi:protein PHTF1-like isoform X2 [Bolinopsis microptera]|uniref:protein PHTF1-like isoform X2 n=1 Tax=Bolinopsis microptera TaxID=2820187 RepID=UPI00307AABD4
MAFGERISDTVDWIQTKIKKHDQAAWEQHAEKKLKDFPKTYTNSKRTKLKKELIDVDLIRGTNFEKPKPAYNWSNIAFYGLFKLIFLPLYFKWWVGKTSRTMYCVLVILWILQIAMAVLVLQVDRVDDVLMCESLTPIVLWLVVGLTFCQAVATDMRKAQKSGISTLIKKSKSTTKNVTTSSSSKPTTKSHLSKQHSHSKGFNKKMDPCPSLRRRVVLRNTENLKANKPGIKSTTASTITSSSSNTNSHDMFPEYSEQEHGNLNMNLITPEPHVYISDSDTSPEKARPNGDAFPTKRKLKDSDSESEIDHRKHHVHRTRKGPEETASSSESERETDSSEHNGMTESMWTESETDSRTPLFKVRKPPFSTINENNTINDNKERHETSSEEHDTDGEDKEVNEPRSATPSGERLENGGVAGAAHRDSITDHSRTERIRVKVWLNDELVKIEMSPLEIGYQIISKVERVKSSLEYVWLGIILSFIMSFLPFVFRAHNADSGFSIKAVQASIIELYEEPIEFQLIHIIGFVLSMSLSCCFFTLFVVAERTYVQRYLYAKFFNALTTMRRAKQYGLPHFRLRSIQNIKAWLSLRSVLRRVGPQRSVGIIITSSFLIMLTILTVVCVQFFSKEQLIVVELEDETARGDSMNMYFTWLAIAWSMCLSIYLLRLFTLGNDINERFDSHSLLITEQINLFFFIQQSPQKKEQLMQANQVLQLSSKLLKEIDSRETSVFFLSPLVSQFLRVFLLSAFSGLASEILGFKLKLWKMIK